MTPEEGSKILIKPCVCGIGNPQRMEKLLSDMAAVKTSRPDEKCP